MEGRLPPRQAVTGKFPVMSMASAPVLDADAWSLTLRHGVRPIRRWDRATFDTLPRQRIVRDIHCVTRWSKLDTAWEGVLLDDLLADAGIDPPTGFVLAHSADGYCTNLRVDDLLGGRAMVATRYGDQPLTADHGGAGPAAGAAPVFLEIRQVAHRPAVHRARGGRVLGTARVSHAGRSVARGTVFRRDGRSMSSMHRTRRRERGIGRYRS